MSSSPDVLQASPNVGDDGEISDTKLNSKYKNNTTHPIIVKTLSSLSSEILIHKKKQETLSQQIKTNKSLYNHLLKQYKTLTQSIQQLESKLDGIHLKISSIKKHKQLILDSITDDSFQYLLGIIPRMKHDVYEEFLSFINYEGYKQEQVLYIMKTKNNLINLLEHAFEYLELMFSISKNKFYSTRNKIAMVYSSNDITYPFEIIYDYFKYSFDLIEQNEEYTIMQKNLEELNNEKNKQFLELKALESDILKKDSNLQNIIKYINNINTVIEKTKINQNNKDTYNDINTTNEEDQFITKNECIPVITKTHTHHLKNHPHRNNNNQHGHSKQSSVVCNSTSQTFSGTMKIKPISVLSLNNKKLDINKKNSNYLTHNTMLKSAKVKHNVNVSSQDNKKQKHSTVSNKVQSASSNTVINIKRHILETVELIKISSNVIHTQPSHTHINKYKYKRNKSNSPQKINTSKYTKTRNHFIYTHQFLTSKQQTNKIKHKILTQSKPLVKDTSSIKIDTEQHEHKNTTDINNLTDQSDNYHINTNSKDSFNISDINSVCDELTVSPLSLLPGRIKNNNNNKYVYRDNKNRNHNHTNNKFMNFKIENPIPSGGCCVSCT